MGETRMIEHNVIEEDSDEEADADSAFTAWNTSRAARFSVICVTQAGSQQSSEDEYSEEEIEAEDYESGEDSDREVMAEDMRALKKAKRNQTRLAKKGLRKIASRARTHETDSDNEESEHEDEGN